MSFKYRVLCGVPESHCTGGPLITDQRLMTKKCHPTHENAYDCMAKYLVRVRRFVRGRNREFRDPNGGPCRVLTKKCRYGSRLRIGKDGRFMPRERNTGNRGLIIG